MSSFAIWARQALEVLGQPALDALQLRLRGAGCSNTIPVRPSSPTLVWMIVLRSTAFAACCCRPTIDHPGRSFGERAAAIPLGEAGPGGPGSQCALRAAPASPGSFAACEDIRAVRCPDGCRWDRELTWDTLRPFLLEETYELLAASRRIAIAEGPRRRRRPPAADRAPSPDRIGDPASPLPPGGRPHRRQAHPPPPARLRRCRQRDG